MQSNLTVRGPFSLKATVLSHGWHECAPMSWTEGGRCFQWVDRWNGKAIRVSVTESRRTVRSVTLEVLIGGAPVTRDQASAVHGRLRRILSLDEDLSGFHRICGSHPVLRVLPRFGGGRTLRSPSMTENIIKALCATNVNWSQAVKMINRLCQLGPAVRHFASLNAWPTPREILRAGERYLLDVCRVGYRSDSIMKFCKDVVEHRVDPESLVEQAADPSVSSDDLLAQLRSIRGIGPSSAHYLLSFLGRHDRLSIDSATIAHVARTHYGGRRPSLKQIEAVYEPYGDWKHLIYWFESWLGWETAREVIAELERSNRKR